MNRTQKEAMGGLIFFTETLVFMASILAARLIFKKDVVYITYFMLATIVITNVLVGLLYLFRKQSPREVITDERDKLIKLKALFASFVSVMISLAAMLVTLRIIVGIKGSIGVWLLALILLVITIAAAMVYYAAVLILYLFGKGNA